MTGTQVVKIEWSDGRCRFHTSAGQELPAVNVLVTKLGVKPLPLGLVFSHGEYVKFPGLGPKSIMKTSYSFLVWDALPIREDKSRFKSV